MFTVKSATGSEFFDISADEAYNMILELEPFDSPTGNEYFYRFDDGDYTFESGCWCPLTFAPVGV